MNSDKPKGNINIVFACALGCAFFALLIHILFKIKTGPECLKAEWEAGDILTYASTVALGLLALWQNKRFKEENDIAQVRLEKLTEQANSLSIINKIIDMETSRLTRLKSAIDDFSKACDPADIIIQFKPANNIKRDGSLIASTIIAKGRIRTSLETLCIELGINLDEEQKELASFPNIIINYSEASIKLIKMFSESLTIAAEEGLKCTQEDWEKIKEQLEIAGNLEKEFAAEKNTLILHKEALIDQIVYGNYTISEIKQLLDKEKNLLREYEKVG